MALHGLLHRIEGDIENSRCWYLDIMQAEVFQHMWPSDSTSTADDDISNSKMSDYKNGEAEYSSKPEEARAKLPAEVNDLLDRIHRLRLHTLKASANPLPAGTKRADEEAALKEISAGEIERLRKFLEDKFGTQRMADAREAYVGVGEQRGEISEKK